MNFEVIKQSFGDLSTIVIIAFIVSITIFLILLQLRKMIYNNNNDTVDENNYKNMDEVDVLITYDAVGLQPLFEFTNHTGVYKVTSLDNVKNDKEVMEFIKFNGLCVGDGFKCTCSKKHDSFIFSNITNPIKNKVLCDTYEVTIKKVKSQSVPIDKEFDELDYILDIFDEEENTDIEHTYKVVGIADKNYEAKDYLVMS